LQTAIAALLACALLTTIASAQHQDRHVPGIPLPRSRPKEDQQTPDHDDGKPPGFATEYRTIDAYGNKPESPELGVPGHPFIRLFGNDYADGITDPAGSRRPSSRWVSNAVVAQDADLPNHRGATDYLWQWGQFLDHDITETPTIDPAEAFDISVPASDPWFDPSSSGDVVIPLHHSYYDLVDGAREQTNEITSFIDASNV
jgi:peroxidase